MGIKLVVVGAGGRMGGRVIALALESSEFDIVGAVDGSTHPALGKDAGQLAGVDPIAVILADQFPRQADVVIDFSVPEATDRTLDFCGTHEAALVLGTTGLEASQKRALENLSSRVPVIYGTNMGVGMNTLFALVGKVAQTLGEAYDIEIVEHHHRFKKDAPSGSALSLAESISEATGRSCPDCLTLGRAGKEALRQKGTIGMHAVRAGDIVGVHSVIYSTLGETITINHTAHSRDTFVRGAIRGAQWLIGKAPGMYSMRDVLGIE